VFRGSITLKALPKWRSNIEKREITVRETEMQQEARDFADRNQNQPKIEEKKSKFVKVTGVTRVLHV
jgi:hypothetical protein